MAVCGRENHGPFVGADGGAEGSRRHDKQDIVNYQSGVIAAHEKLRMIARDGEKEAAIIIDRATGVHLNFQTGGQDEVTPDWSKIPQGVKVTILHTHSENV